MGKKSILKSVSYATSVNPDMAVTTILHESSYMNSQAFKFREEGNYPEAERRQLLAVQLCERAIGPNSTTTATSWNNLGEVYILMDRLDDAEKYLRKALKVREASNEVFDASVSRENLARVYECRGDLQEARAIRWLGAPDKIACGNYKVRSDLSKPSRTRLTNGERYQCIRETLKRKELMKCGNCKASRRMSYYGPHVHLI